MSKSLPELIGPLGKHDIYQTFHTLLFSIENKKNILRYLFFAGQILFGLQLNFMYIYNSSKLLWYSEKVHETVLYIVNCVFTLSPGIKDVTYLDFLTYSLLIVFVGYSVAVLVIYFVATNSRKNRLGIIIPFGVAIMGAHILVIPSSFACVTYIFIGNFREHYLRFILAFLLAIATNISIYIEYFIHYGIPKKDSIYNSKTLLFRFIFSFIMYFFPMFNFYIESKVGVGILNGICFILSSAYILQQFRLSSPRTMMSFSLSAFAGSLLNLLTLFVTMDGETYTSIFIIMFNIGFLLFLLISYFTKEYILLPFREVIQTHDYSKFDKYSNFTLENIMTAASSQIDIPNDVLEYLEQRNPHSFVFNEIIFLQSKEYGNQEKMKSALDMMLSIPTSDAIRKIRICAFENLIHPAFLKVRANLALSDYSNTLGMFWNEIVNDNTDHLISLSTEVTQAYYTLTTLFKEYGSTGELAETYEQFCKITNYNADTKNANFAYALVSRSGSKGESSFAYSHFTHHIFIYMAIVLFILNVLCGIYLSLEINGIWCASIDSFKIIQSLSAGSFISTLIQLNSTTNLTDSVYNNALFKTKLTNLTTDMIYFIGQITNYTNSLKTYSFGQNFHKIVDAWLSKSFNVTRFPSTIETATGFIASCYQSVINGGTPQYEGLYVKGTTDLIIYSAELDVTVTSLSHYALDIIDLSKLIIRIINCLFIIFGLCLMIVFTHLTSISVQNFFQPLFKLSKTDLIQMAKDLISWVKESPQTENEDNNIKYNRELIISKTHTNTQSNTHIKNKLIFNRFSLFLVFVAILWVLTERVLALLTDGANDIGVSAYPFLLPQQLLKFGQLFLLSLTDVVKNNETESNSTTTTTLRRLNNLQINSQTFDKLDALSKLSRLLHSDFNDLSYSRILNEITATNSDDINWTATHELREKHMNNLVKMIEFSRNMVQMGTDRLSKYSPRVMDISLYITTLNSDPLSQRALFSAVDIMALNIYDVINKQSNDTNIEGILNYTIMIATMYTHLCEESIQMGLYQEKADLLFAITVQAIISLMVLLVIYTIYRTSGTLWITMDSLTKSIISSLPKFNNTSGHFTDSISLSTREEEMKKSSAIVVDIMNSYELRESLLEHHILLNSNEVVVSSSSLIEDFLASPPMMGRKFDDCINAIGIIIPNDGNEDKSRAAVRTLFRPKDEKKREVVMEILKFKFDNIDMKEGNISYVCVVTDKTKEYESMRQWRNELNQLKLLSLQFIPNEIYDGLTGEESFSTVQINNAYVATFFISHIENIEQIAAIKDIIINTCKEYSHIWAVSRSVVCIQIFSGLLDQNISIFRALITLLHVSLKIGQSISDIGCEPHCVISKVKAAGATFSLDSPPVFDMRDDNPYELILAMGSPAHKVSISRDPYEILYNTGIMTEFSFYFRSEGFHKVSYDTLHDVEIIVEREQAQLAIV